MVMTSCTHPLCTNCFTEMKGASDTMACPICRSEIKGLKPSAEMEVSMRSRIVGPVSAIIDLEFNIQNELKRTKVPKITTSDHGSDKVVKAVVSNL